MPVRLVAGSSNVLEFPGETRIRPSVELLMELAPPRSLVDTLSAERGDPGHDSWAGFAREFAHQARTLEIGHGREVAVIDLRSLVDAHVAHAVRLCRLYQAAADRMISLEVRAVQAERLSTPIRIALMAARTEMRGHALAARTAADGALGAATALAAYIREGSGVRPVSDAEPRQMLLFATVGG
jgi:hypothetical protein